MKFLKIFLKGFIALAVLTVVSLYIFDFDYLLKAVRVIYLQGHSTAFLKDYENFDNSLIKGSETPYHWPLSKNYNELQPTTALNRLNDEYESVAFLIIKNDSLLYEQYFDGYTKDSKSNSFSMAKTLVSAMMEKAIMQGKIKGLDQPVGDFFPEFRGGLASTLTVGDLSSMSSGLNWDESYYSPFSITTRAYFDEDLRKVILGLQVIEEPGKKYKYLSGNTQLLAMVIQAATGQELPEYLSENFWKPMGAESDAFWQLDSNTNQLVKAYCCIAGNARDFARFGRLYKDHGKWNGKQLLDSSFVALSTRPRFSSSPEYGYGLWLLNYKDHDFFMLRGHLGQYVIVNPRDNLIIVRLGHRTAPKKENAIFSEDIYGYIDESYKMITNAP